MAIRCIVVTPERTELDTEATSVTLPMFDGSLGVLPNRAPMIGRLGYGKLELETAAGPQRFFVDGGFAQVEDNTVNLLTSRSIPVDLLDVGEAEKSLEEALEMSAKTPEQAQLRETAIRRARGQLRAAR
ncbi:F0F1 ATP synthase subunit epsilon [Roseiconus lacunae]|uniref:ATP synthase epsilon chain n=1 Tax=Roseiconus lacunae TaxID=2605694 RepID=A0ABT7PM85_9BACT|nr:F0F1 ATP synthase subunit epsilon [Roseiconus lacunae]MCD0461523.1 F0F1 ATP synthase subunit epsilon [Roseiconus lacunae]MDM4017600.1 F0F1 ATP synthase subunit epsilon [Roseiconus lacunae]WRQ51136.1 F0F1 ATP synthase subunit epsilon [Stieleria sp. HD01]